MEEKLKWHLSKYNLFGSFSIDNLLPCVNLMKGTYLELNSDDILLLYHLDNINEQDEKIQNFIEQGIIVNYNEQELLKSMALKMSNQNNSLKITIAVTLACNFNCPYCFEFHKNQNKMSLEIQNQIIKTIEQSLMAGKFKKINVTWYGGEPLLESELIKVMSQRLISFTEEHHIKYSSNIITNGYLFTQKNADILKEAKVDHCQITLDGLEKNHNKTRHLIGDGETFNVIIKNLRETKFEGHISIRCNINNNNKEEFEQIKELINNIANESGNNISCYSAIVINNPAIPCDNKIQFLNELDSAKISLKKDIKHFGKVKPLFCAAQKYGSFCVDNEGYLYKCWEDVGKIERSFGNVKTFDSYRLFETIDNIDVLTKYINSVGILNDEECQKCIWLPICSGGCPSKRLYCNIKCIPYKNYPDLFIQEIGKHFKNKYK